MRVCADASATADGREGLEQGTHRMYYMPFITMDRELKSLIHGNELLNN